MTARVCRRAVVRDWSRVEFFPNHPQEVMLMETPKAPGTARWRREVATRDFEVHTYYLLLIPQGHHGIDLDRAAGGQRGRRKRNGCDDAANNNQRHRVVNRDPEQFAAN